MAPLRCDRCQTLLPGAVVNTRAPAPCPACGTALVLQVFPAFARPAPRGRAAEPLGSAEEAGCFYHPQKKAAVPCEDCGRFLCALCDLEIDGRHFCPACVEIARQAGRGLRIGPRTLHDRVALSVAVAGALLAALTSGIAAAISVPAGLFVLAVTTLVSTLATLFLVVLYWNEPMRGPVPRGRTRLILAAGLALLQVAGWLILLYGHLHPSSRVL